MMVTRHGSLTREQSIHDGDQTRVSPCLLLSIQCKSVLFWKCQLLYSLLVLKLKFFFLLSEISLCVVSAIKATQSFRPNIPSNDLCRIVIEKKVFFPSSVWFD